jgi:hypothetical protein
MGRGWRVAVTVEDLRRVFEGEDGGGRMEGLLQDTSPFGLATLLATAVAVSNADLAGCGYATPIDTALAGDRQAELDAILDAITIDKAIMIGARGWDVMAEAPTASKVRYDQAIGRLRKREMHLPGVQRVA